MDRIAPFAQRRDLAERRRRRVRRVVATAALEAALAHPTTPGQRRRSSAPLVGRS